MKLKELKREFKKILKQTSQRSPQEQIRFLIKKIQTIKVEELKILTLIYLDYVITKKNEKGIRFIIPKIEELKKVASSLRIDREEGLESIIKLENSQTSQENLSQKLYNTPTNMENVLKKSKYQHTTDYRKEFKSESQAGYISQAENTLYFLSEEQRTSKLLEYAFNPQKRKISKEIKLDYL